MLINRVSSNGARFANVRSNATLKFIGGNFTMINIPGYREAGNGYSKVGDVVVIELKEPGKCSFLYAGQAVGVYPLMFGGTLLRKISKGSGTQPTASNPGSLPCPDDCDNKKGQCCLLGANHCIRDADDFYRPRQAGA